MDWMIELFFAWQDRQVYRKEESYSKILIFMENNLSEEQALELEDLVAETTHEHMLDAFAGGFSVCRDLMLSTSNKNFINLITTK